MLKAENNESNRYSTVHSFTTVKLPQGSELFSKISRIRSQPGVNAKWPTRAADRAAEFEAIAQFNNVHYTPPNTHTIPIIILIILIASKRCDLIVRFFEHFSVGVEAEEKRSKAWSGVRESE